MRSLQDYIRNVLETIRYSYGELLVSNIFWLLLMVPIVTNPPAFAGLYYATSQLAHNEPVNRETFFEGFRKYFRASYGWFFSNVLVVGLLLFNIDLSIRFTQVTWMQYFSGVYWLILALWILLQIYTFPLLIKQDRPRFFLALRNSALLWFKHGLFSIFLAVVLGLIIVISLYLFPLWFVITGSLSTYLANLGLIYLLSKEITI